jgi:hypothetical protein
MNSRGATDWIAAVRAWRDVGVAAVAMILFVFAATLHLALESRFARAGVLRESNVLFDADPNTYEVSFARGHNVSAWGGRSFAHPHISNLVNPPINLAVSLVAGIRPQADTASLRRRLALAVSPLAISGEASFLFLAALELGAPFVGAGLVALLSVAAFSGLVFGSIPESYALSGLALAVLFWLAARTARTRRISVPLWIALGTLATGITITNVGIVAAIALGALIGAKVPVWSALYRTLGLAVAVVVATAVTYEVAATVARDAPRFSPAQTGQIDELGHFDAGKATRGFPAALANTLAPAVPILLPYTEARQAHDFIITYRAAAGPVPDQDIHTAVVLVLLLLCAVGAVWMHDWQRAVVLGAALAIGYSWLLHAWFGKELFLYSQHWAVAELIVVAATLWFPGRWRVLGYGVIAAGLAACVINDEHVFGAMWRILADRAR